jgi:hypothetical protein
MKLANMRALGARARKSLWVRVPPPARHGLVFLSLPTSLTVPRTPTAQAESLLGRRRGNSRLPDRKPVLLGQGPQLLESEPAAASALRDQNARPQALRAGDLTRFLSAAPAAGTGAAEFLRTVVGGRRPPVWIPRTYNCRDPQVLHPARLSLRTEQYDCIVGAIRTYCRPR